MSQKDYISDNLITMRDRLRESTAAIREAAEQKKTQEEPQSTARPIPVAENVPDRRMAEGLRAKQDLAGRLARDLAKVCGILSSKEQQIRELQQVRDALQTLEKNLDQITPAGSAGLFAAETDRLRLEYFRICGALEALTANTAAGTGREAQQEESRKDKTMLTAAWIIGGTILAGAILIAAVTAKIFL
ncbi:MAG: hypothetical protein IJC34_09960 [Lentisphaeria bacterium]|nr:hypothetical protein [Lentisphaeria bacterium]MBQ7393526.1 hypothetical protein [Lentisphaeria bacterium]